MSAPKKERKYCYVYAGYLPLEGNSKKYDNILSFWHVFLKAVDDNQAYERGFKELRRKKNIGDHVFCNDYVVRIPE